MLYHYVVVCEIEDNPCQVFLCWADDVSHAIEQCDLAYPGCIVTSVVRSSSNYRLEVV